jgi:predicted ATP-grasp superfamily ATP-dependent carboligase
MTVSTSAERDPAKGPIGETVDVATIGAVIMDADYRALGVVRSLGRRGIPVWVFCHGDQLLATVSRYRKRVLQWPSDNEEQRIEYLIRLAQDGIRGWLLIPTGDEAAALVARNHSVLGAHYRLSTPEWEVFQHTYNKKLTYALADRAGVPHPCTYYPRNRAEVETGSYQFPVILKAAYRIGLNSFTADKAWPAKNSVELLLRYDQACTLVNPAVVMVQQIIPGDGQLQLSYTALCDHGRVLASVAACRRRQYPADFGRSSTFVETIDQARMTELAQRLLSALRFTGLIEIEFKKDLRDGELKLLDMNARIWGWQSLCGEAGVDYPYLLWQMLVGHSVPHVEAKLGVRWIRFSTDALAAISEMLHGRLHLREYLLSLKPPLSRAIYNQDDPLPGILELPLMMYLLAKRMVTRGRIG